MKKLAGFALVAIVLVYGATSAHAFVSATGGTVYTSGDYKIHVFTTSGTFNVTTAGTLDDVIIVGGGGGGGSNAGAGAGAGGVIIQASQAVTTGAKAVIVGAGGAGAVGATTHGANGVDSSFNGSTAIGGGGGGSTANDGVAGGSGGGAGAYSGVAASGTSGQGNSGGPHDAFQSAGGGGGKGAAATDQNGGTGIYSAYFESYGPYSSPPGYFAAGGGGGSDSDVDSGTSCCGAGDGTVWGDGSGGSGAANTGSGGGGGGGNNESGGNGGSGFVIIRYQFQGSVDATPPTVSVTAPASGATVSGASVTISANASDNVGVVGVQFKLDGVNIGTEDTSSPYSISWDSSTVSDGGHTITAVARDAATNETTSTGVVVTVSNGGGGGGTACPSGAGVSSLSGWAWSETFGWISFNSSDSGAGGGPYCVAIDDASGNWSGYAWSEYLGWISFHASDVTSNCSGFSAPHFDSSTGAVTGGAYASALGTSGCIELSGTGHSSPTLGGTGGVTFDSGTGSFVGYAWGGDSTTDSGPGWIQFDSGTPSISVVCPTCVGGGAITGSCTPITAYQNIPAGSTVTFQAAGTSGTGPYNYNWSGEGYDLRSPTNQFSTTYSSSSSGPSVVVKDSLAVESATISCPSVTVAPSGAGTSDIHIGKTVAGATFTTLTIKQKNQFALKWNFTLTDDYSCTPTVSPDPNLSNWNTYWKSRSLGMVDNGDGTLTFSGNTTDPGSGTNLVAGSASDILNPGIYSFAITCDSLTSVTTRVVNTLKVNLSGETEI